MSVLDIGASALQTAYTRLQTTGHNIANASTPGYSRQRVEVASLRAQYGAGGFIGGGVEVATISRQYDQHLEREVNTSSALLNGSQIRSDSLSRVDRLFSDSQNGLGPRYDAFNSSLADMVNRPDDMAARTVAMERAGALAGTIDAMHIELERIGTDADQQIDGTVLELNDHLADLSRLNSQLAGLAGSTNPPNDLLDQRDALITTISGIVQTQTELNDDRTVSLFTVGGHALVLGDEPSTVNVDRDPGNPQQWRMVLETQGQPVALHADMLGAGKLPGLLQFRNLDLNAAQVRLGRIAGALADAYNRQQALGVDLNGNAGMSVFQTGTATALASPDVAGNAQLSITIADGTALQASDYLLEQAGGQTILTRLSDGEQTLVTGWPQSIDGLSIDLTSGAMVDGDTILLKTASAFSGNFRSVLSAPSQWANALAVLPVTGADNSGDLSVTQFDVLAADANLSEPVSMVFAAGNMVVISGNGTGNPGAVPWSPGVPLSYNGWEISLQGDPDVGDTILIAPPTNSASDNRNARAIYAIGQETIIDGRAPSQAVGEMIGEIGERSLTATRNTEQAEAWHQGALTEKDAISGVNLDEEAARLLQFQQAYQAAARLISTSQTMFDSLLAATR